LVGKPEGRRPFGRSRRKREDNVRISLIQIGLQGVDWIIVARIGTSGELL
jgi:hypothetical protein